MKLRKNIEFNMLLMASGCAFSKCPLNWDRPIQALKPNEDKATKLNRNIERLQQIKEKAMKASSSE